MLVTLVWENNIYVRLVRFCSYPQEKRPAHRDKAHLFRYSGSALCHDSASLNLTGMPEFCLPNMKVVLLSGGLGPTTTSSPPPVVQERSVASCSSTILVTHRCVFARGPSGGLVVLAPHCVSHSFAAGDRRLRHRRLLPQLAPESAALRGRLRQETVLLDD